MIPGNLQAIAMYVNWYNVHPLVGTDNTFSDLQCNELNRGHPRFFSQSQDEFRTKESEFVHFGPNTNERSNLTGN